MQRREFLAVLGGAATWPHAAQRAAAAAGSHRRAASLRAASSMDCGTAAGAARSRLRGRQDDRH